jgi:hypothetical protein
MSGDVFRSAAAIVLSGAALAACASLKPKTPPPAPPTVAVPAAPVVAPVVKPPPPTVVVVKASCVPKALPHAPKYPDTDVALLDAGGAADRYQLMAAGRLLRIRRLLELEKVVDACR